MKETKKIPLPLALAALGAAALLFACIIGGIFVVTNLASLSRRQRPVSGQETCVKEAVNGQWSGSGNTGTVETLTIPCPGAVFFLSSHTGDDISTFSVALKTRDGEHLQYVALCVGECEKEEVVNLDPGLYLVEIESSDGSWVVVVGQ